MKTALLVILATLFVAIAAPAQTTWKIDRAHSRIDFTVTHMLVSEVTGRFSDFEGTVVASKDDFSDAKINVTIKVGSIGTDNEFRDKDLRSDNFFNTDSFPTSTFRSTSVEKTGENTYRIVGDLTIRNITKPVVLDAHYNGQITTSRGTKAGFKATTTINRFDFGVKWNRTVETGGLVVGKDVKLTLLLELDKQAAQ